MNATTTGTTGTSPVAGRYGADPVATERRMKRFYLAGVAVFLLLVAVIGGKYVLSSSVSGEVEAFQVVSPSLVEIHLQVSKGGGEAASCTVRSRDVNGDEVGRVTVTVPKSATTWDTVVHLKTSAQGNTGELVGCSS